MTSGGFGSRWKGLGPERPPRRGDVCAHRRVAQGWHERDTSRNGVASVAGEGSQRPHTGLAFSSTLSRNSMEAL